MPTRDILESHPLGYLREQVKKSNISGFATMKKDKLIDEMMKRVSDFHHIVHSGRKGRTSYEGKKRPKSTLEQKRDLRKTKAGRLQLIQESLDNLPVNASKGRIEALKARLRVEQKTKSKT
tara:strand:- start:780 stop:1142 length:363 start_codon:yes stop_codon:yes gene_type:complete